MNPRNIADCKNTYITFSYSAVRRGLILLTLVSILKKTLYLVNHMNVICE